MLHPIKHFMTITKHRHKVMRYCFKVGIGFQGLFHDLSKYSFTEFWRGAKYYAGTRSPNANEREDKGYSLAWMHHKGRNKHHYEYWTDVQGGTYAPVLIPIKYLKESLCDRIAASKVYMKKQYTSSSALEYFEKRECSYNQMHPTTAFVLKTWLTWVSEFGEKKAFKKIKKIKSYKDMEGGKMKIDLHNHSIYSDGLYPPKELLEIAKREHVDCFALTDHDSVFGCEELIRYAKESGIRVLAGMELSTDYKGYSVHIVCLFKNNIVPKKLFEFSYNKKEERKKRAIKMMERIKEVYHVKIDLKSLLAESEVITRANMCYNIAKCNHISEREAEIYVDTKSKAYIPSTKLSVEEGLKMVKEAGCFTILAHPCLLPRSIVEEILPMGFDGIEVRYPKNQEKDEDYFKALALKHNLLISAGSDFHGDHGTKHAMMGTSTLTLEEFKPILERLGLEW